MEASTDQVYTSRRALYAFHACPFVRPHLSLAQYITSYVTMQLSCIAAFRGLQVKLLKMKILVCCIDNENLVGSHKYPVFVAYSYKLEVHNETAISAISPVLRLIAYHFLQDAYCSIPL